MKKPKCKACYDKGYYTQFVGESGSDDFGGEGYVIDPHIQKFPCPKCIRIENGHKEDCDFVNSDQGVCNCFSPKPQEKSEQGILQDGKKPYPQPTDGLIDWGEKELESFFVAYFCYYSNSTPKTYEFNQKNKEKVKKQASNFIRQLLTEQKQKTREDTIDECLTVLRSFKDKHFCLDCNKKEFLPSLKALKSKKQ